MLSLLPLPGQTLELMLMQLADLCGHVHASVGMNFLRFEHRPKADGVS